jgi:orotate phosphoribosyltransferase
LILTEDEVLQEFQASGALLKGHFILSSGLHSDTYLQCARVMTDTARAARLCAALAEKLRTSGALDAGMVIAPAMGAILPGYEMGRQLGFPTVFFERVEGKFTLRRGFEIAPGTKCLMVEDVVTTGLSSRECMEAAEAFGAKVTVACSFINRSGGRTALGIPLISLLTLDIPAYPADQIPAALQALPAVKPGSRGLKS